MFTVSDTLISSRRGFKSRPRLESLSYKETALFWDLIRGQNPSAWNQTWQSVSELNQISRVENLPWQTHAIMAMH